MSMNPEAELTQDQLAEIVFHLNVVKTASLAYCVMYYYDFFLTFGEEVNSIWLRKFTKFTPLWFLNRYIPALGFAVVISSNFSNWGEKVCRNYVLFPEILRLITCTVIGLVFIVRLYALYSGSRNVALMASLLLVAELSIKIWSFTDGTNIHLPPGLSGCLLVGKDQLRFTFTWIAELGFDTAMFALACWRTIKLYRSAEGNISSLLDLIIRDGIIYFAVIFLANLMTCFLFLFAPADLKAVTASFSSLISTLMVSRLILNLRAAGNEDKLTQAGITGLETLNTNTAYTIPLKRLENGHLSITTKSMQAHSGSS